MFEAVGSVLEASLSRGSEEPMEADHSQVGALDQMWASCMLHSWLMLVFLGGSFSSASRWGNGTEVTVLLRGWEERL